MALKWSARANEDLRRLHAFVAPVDLAAANEVVHLVVAAVRRLARQPRIGPRLTEFEPRELRRLIVGDYEIRYELDGDDLFILRVFHQREAR